MLINRVGAFAMLIMSVYLTDERGASASLAGLVVGGYGIGGVAGTLLGGVLADHWGRRATLFWSHTVAAGLMAALAFTTHLGLIAVLTVLLGLVHSMPMPAFVAAIVDVVPAERRSRAFNLQFWSFNLGMAAAGLLAGLLAQVELPRAVPRRRGRHRGDRGGDRVEGAGDASSAHAATSTNRRAAHGPDRPHVPGLRRADASCWPRSPPRPRRSCRWRCGPTGSARPRTGRWSRSARP